MRQGGREKGRGGRERGIEKGRGAREGGARAKPDNQLVHYKANAGPIISSDNLNKETIQTWLCFCLCAHCDFQTLQSKFSY